MKKVFWLYLYAVVIVLVAVFGLPGCTTVPAEPTVELSLEIPPTTDDCLNAREWGTGETTALAVMPDLKDPDEWYKMKLYPGFGEVSAFTGEDRFGNGCRQATVTVDKRTYKVLTGAYLQCPGKDPDMKVDAFDHRNVSSGPLEAEWAQRALQFRREIEEVAFRCFPKDY